MANRGRRPMYLHQLKPRAPLGSLPVPQLPRMTEKVNHSTASQVHHAFQSAPSMTTDNTSADGPPLTTNKSTTPSSHVLPSSSRTRLNLRSHRSSAPPPQNIHASASNQPELNTPIIEQSEPSQASHSAVQDQDMNISGSKMCKKRSITRGTELTKRKRAGETFEVNIPSHTKRDVGKSAQLYITQGGCIVRRFAPLQVDSWSDISNTDVAGLVRRVREQFSLTDEPHVNAAIVDDLKRIYYSWRYALRKIHDSYDTVEDALENRPDRVAEDDWKYLINLWESDSWKKLSTKNKQNREQLKITHCAGTKAFSRIRYENINSETGEEPTRIDLFKLTRFSTKKGSWVGEEARTAHVDMENLKNQSQTNESTEVLLDDQVYDKVLDAVIGHPPRPGYIRGLGAGPKPKNSRMEQHNREQVEEATRRANEATQMADEAARRADDAEERARKLAEELAMVKANAEEHNKLSTFQSTEIEALKAQTSKMDGVVQLLLQRLTPSAN